MDEGCLDDDLDDFDEDDDDDRMEFTLDDLERDAKQKGSPIVVEERTISDFEKLVGFANEHGRPIFIEESVIENVRIQTADVPIDIDDSVLIDLVDCNRGRFNKGIHFSEVVFGRDVSFNEAAFHAALSFDDCEFEGSVDFSTTVFEKGASFVSCDFEKETSFDGAQFKGRVDFRYSVFKKKAVFKNTFFSKVVDLDKVTFESGYDTTGSNLEEVKKTVQTKQKTATKSRSQGDMKPKRKEFNPWAELDRVSKKQMSRRDLFRGIRNLIPKRDDS